MAFRSDKDASRHRIDALEDELEEKDAELLRLRAEVEKRDAEAKRPAKAAQSSRPRRSKGKRRKDEDPPVDVPAGDSWSVRVYSPLLLLLPAGFGVAVCVAALGVGATPGQPTVRWLGMLLPVVVVALAFSEKVMLDRPSRRVVKAWGPFRVRLADGAFSVREYVTSSENGPSIDWGRVCYGKHRLLGKRKGEAQLLARRMAAFMGASYQGSRFDEQEQQRVAMGALVGTFGLSAFLGAVAGLAYLLGLVGGP